jgi:membrane-associated phospholipid phosphatase
MGRDRKLPELEKFHIVMEYSYRGIPVRFRFVGVCLSALLCVPAGAGDFKESAGTAVAIALPVAAAGITAYKKDWKGTAQLLVVTTLTVGTAYGLKHLVRECRPFAKPCSPGGSNWDSFPSDTTALASAPAGFLWARYGWQYGVPAFLASSFVGYSRVDAKKHNWWDTLASTGISIAYNGLITTRYKRKEAAGFYSSLDGGSDGLFLSAGYRW